MFIDDTIAAIATAPGEGGIGIIRISGEKSLQVAESIFKSVTGKLIKDYNTRTLIYGTVVDGEKVIDEALVAYMKGPKSYTGEDVIEINCHGGFISVKKILELILSKDVRLADAGEFTKRAFLNGRVDLSQAEAVMDLIRAKTDKAMGLALNQLDGNLSSLIRSLRHEILETLAQVEVNIDYPEYDDVEELTTRLLLEKATMIQQRIQALLATSKQGKVLREGLSTAIIGRPNVGKSSLLNHLLREEKAIVTDIAGTTRDVIEEYVNVRGVPLKLIDTAGIRETEDLVEQIGVERSRKALSESDLILLVLNQSEPLTREDEQLLEATKGLKRIVLLNKTDLPQKLEKEELDQWLEDEPVFAVSVAKNDGLDQLETAIADLFFGGQTGERDATYVSNTRHIALLEKASISLAEVVAGIEAGMPVDLVQIDMTRCWDYLGEVVGDSVQDELITQLFSQFCLGK